MNSKNWIRALAALAVAACSHDAPTPSRSTADGGNETNTRSVHLSAQVIADAKIKTGVAVKENLFGALELLGETASIPDRTSRIASPVAGRIERLTFNEGSVVAKGDTLAIVRVPELGRIRTAYAATVAHAKAARALADRSKALRAEGLTSAQEYLDAKAEAQSLDADARGLAEQLAAMGMSADGSGLLTLRAPMPGIVLARDAVAGQPVNADQSLGTIADLTDVWFMARTFEKSLARLALGAKAEVTLSAYPQEKFDGTVTYVGHLVDPATRTLSVRVQIANAGGRLRVGLFGTARVLTDEAAKRPPVVAVPRTALAKLTGRTVVFVAIGDGSFEAHDVVVGEQVLDEVEIKSGIVEGQTIVVEGGFTIKSALLKSTLSEGE